MLEIPSVEEEASPSNKVAFADAHHVWVEVAPEASPEKEAEAPVLNSPGSQAQVQGVESGFKVKWKSRTQKILSGIQDVITSPISGYLVPLAVLAFCLTVGIIGILSISNATYTQRQNEAFMIATAASGSLVDALYRAALPGYWVATWIKDIPQEGTMGKSVGEEAAVEAEGGHHRHACSMLLLGSPEGGSPLYSLTQTLPRYPLTPPPPPPSVPPPQGLPQHHWLPRRFRPAGQQRYPRGGAAGH